MCWATVAYPNKTIFVDVINNNNAVIGSGYYDEPINKDIYNIYIQIDQHEIHGLSIQVAPNISSEKSIREQRVNFRFEWLGSPERLVTSTFKQNKFSGNLPSRKRHFLL